MRIAKAIAHAGLCSRREAEAWILQGRIAVNGKVLESPAFCVTESDTVTVDGEPLPKKEPIRLWKFHKPTDLVTTHKDPQGRSTVFEYIQSHHPNLPRVISVGRLDLATEGLLLLTNDGSLARHLELPTTGWRRQYRVRVYGHINEKALKDLQKGITVDGIRYAPIQAAIDRKTGKNSWIMLTLTEGKNREIRKILAHLDLMVSRLIRLSYGPFHLGNLDKGKLQEIPQRILKEQLGSKFPIG